MVEENDRRLLNDRDHLEGIYLNPTDGEEIERHAPDLRACIFCRQRGRGTPHQRWFVPEDISCCICEECCNDFKERFHWKKPDGWDLERD